MGPAALPVEPADIPVIDCSLFTQEPQKRAKALQQLDNAFATYGVVYLSNHCISQDMINEAFHWVGNTHRDLIPLDLLILWLRRKNSSTYRTRSNK